MGKLLEKGRRIGVKRGERRKAVRIKALEGQKEGRIVVKERGRKWEKLVRGRRKDATPYDKRR